MQALINACATKPVVKLLINRHNNKYSYTGASDDNLLKNIELFDKLSLRFSNRVLFIKDVIGSNEICCWSFYGHGKKIAEVCCTAIVYATDRKNTKVKYNLKIFINMISDIFFHNIADVWYLIRRRKSCFTRSNFQKLASMKRHWTVCYMKIELVLTKN